VLGGKHITSVQTAKTVVEDYVNKNGANTLANTGNSGSAEKSLIMYLIGIILIFFRLIIVSELIMLVKVEIAVVQFC